MTEDAFPPSDPLAPPEEEELEAANALRQALDGRPGGPRVPEEALQTAAFLRHAGDGGRLSSERQAKLRAELLASLPAVPARAPRKSWRSWFGIGITLIGAASAAVTVGVLGVREWSTQDRAAEALATARETAGNESAASPSEPRPPALGVRASPEVASAPAEAEALSQAASDDGEPMLAQRAIGGLAQPELDAPATAAERARIVTRMTAPSANAAPGGGAPGDALGSGASYGPAPSKVARRAAGSAAWDREVAPADQDDALASRASGGAAESKGRGAAAMAPVAAPPAPAKAVPAEPASQSATADARIERKRQAQRGQLLARLADTPAPAAYRDAESARSVSELERARERLTALSSAGLGGTSSAAEAEQLRPDVYCRLAEIALRLAQPRAALDWAQRGLALGTEPSPFVACLYQQQGRAKEALGDRDGAAQSYLNALKVNERLLDESLEGP